MNKFIAGSIVSIGLTAATVALSAQTVTPPGAGGQTMQHGEQHHGKRAFSMPGERVEARLAYMKTALKITDAQQAQWNAFADVARKQRSSTRQAHPGIPLPHGAGRRETREAECHRSPRAPATAPERCSDEPQRAPGG